MWRLTFYQPVIFFAAEILVIRLAKTYYLDEFQTWLEYQTGKLYAKQTVSRTNIRQVVLSVIAAAASEPETNERGSSLISRRLHYRGLQSLFLTKRKELWLCANGKFRMRSGMRKELWLCANGNILGCAVIRRKELWLCVNG